MNDKEIIQKLIESANKIATVSSRGSANYIITNKNIGDILKKQFYRTDRIIKIEKIIKQLDKS